MFFIAFKITGIKGYAAFGLLHVVNHQNTRQF